MKGLAIHGYSCGENRWQTAWVDSVHNGTRIMLSLGTVPGEAEGLSPYLVARTRRPRRGRSRSNYKQVPSSCRERANFNATLLMRPDAGTVPNFGDSPLR
jgi:hypothetical protein